MRGNKEEPAKFDGIGMDVDVVSFFFRAAAQSQLETKILGLMNELQRLRESANVNEGDILMAAKKFCEICKPYRLGDPLIYAKWFPTQRAGCHDNADTTCTDAWAYLTRVLDRLA